MIHRGEIWDINLDLTIGREINKKRPAVVISGDAIGKLPLKIIVPITGWNPQFSNLVWMVPIDPNSNNGLEKRSAADAFQVRSVSEERFAQKRGRLSEPILDAIAAAIAICVEYK